VGPFRRLLQLATLAATLAPALALAGPPAPSPSPRPDAPPAAPLPVEDDEVLSPPQDDAPPDATDRVSPAVPTEPTPSAPSDASDPAAPTEPKPGDAPPTDAPPTDAPPTEPGAAPPSDAPPSEPGEVELGDALAPVDAALDALRAEGFTVGEPQRTTNPLQGEVLTVDVQGTKSDYLRYVLETVAGDGYLVLLQATGPDRYAIVALRARQGQERGLTFIGVAAFDITGKFRPGESAATLSKLIEHGGGLIIPDEVVEVMRSVGYRAEVRASGVDHVEIRVVPGRSIRRVRVHGQLPLGERDVRRVLSPSSRPGALAPPCVDVRKLRKGARPPVCDPDDPVCKAWEAAERTRIERYLFDEGYLRGTVKFGVACGHKGDDAVLHV
jgi:hypothetical protein